MKYLSEEIRKVTNNIGQNYQNYQLSIIIGKAIRKIEWIKTICQTEKIHFKKLNLWKTQQNYINFSWALLKTKAKEQNNKIKNFM